jgi:hypothetical protein
VESEIYLVCWSVLNYIKGIFMEWIVKLKIERVEFRMSLGNGLIYSILSKLSFTRPCNK